MASQDFIRRMPEARRDLQRRGSLAMRLHLDLPLLFLLLLATGFGLVVLYSAGSESLQLIKRQIVVLALAFAGLFIVAQVRLHSLMRWSFSIWFVAVLLLVAVLLFGVGAKGAQRWLGFGSVRFQPSEVMKLALPVALAAYLAQRSVPPRFKHVFWSLVIIFTPTILILRQPDLGTALLVAFSGLAVLFVAGLPWRYIIGAVSILLASVWPVWEFGLRDYQRQRILTLLNPEVDKLGAGWNIIQSKTAIGSGGLSGKGWLQGTQSHLDFLPESHTDFIIAVLAEEFGLFGVLALLGIYLLIIGRGLAIAVNAQDAFGRLLAASITLTFFIYVFVNMGMVAGLLPVVGIPLPLMSYGGTAMLTLMAGFGLLMAISTQERRLTI